MLKVKVVLASTSAATKLPLLAVKLSVAEVSVTMISVGVCSVGVSFAGVIFTVTIAGSLSRLPSSTLKVKESTPLASAFGR